MDIVIDVLFGLAAVAVPIAAFHTFVDYLVDNIDSGED